LNSENNATAMLVFDRSKYDVRFRSGSFFDELGDKLILDDIKLEVALEFN
ncbi:MAG: lipid-binding protein, partial [Candidatus Marinimicrobia bacterium]|nr:lipid-binding protein [Candidatus Neomarinimicrobiota bacterium]